ncbi:hypothetical protein JAAARDRAFT_487552 [Jaapia argillacea MUCL 33604]|uniref:Uncharacterized protein n=1 Tax=Jaapia argillacea MUCL 33604 TaxID=933084 RepID=A0A067PBZ7_9AGAM|nr:hypothetical protein JAAARDRAFT_487552 [Jaapia argillacea MUCL 33604]
MSSGSQASEPGMDFDPLKDLCRPNFNPSNPPVIPLFVYRTFLGIGLHYSIAIALLGDFIKGHRSIADIWSLWRPGDEEWVRNYMQSEDSDSPEDNKHLVVPDEPLSIYEWSQYQRDYEQRTMRLAEEGGPDLWPASLKQKVWTATAPIRIAAIMWLMLVSPISTPRGPGLTLEKLVSAWIRVSKGPLASSGFANEPLAEFVRKSSDHTCSFWDTPTSLWATLFSWLYDYQNYPILVALCDTMGVTESEEDEDCWSGCVACESVLEEVEEECLPWILHPKVSQSRPTVWQTLSFMVYPPTVSMEAVEDIRDDLYRFFDCVSESSLVEYLPLLEEEFQKYEVKQSGSWHPTWVSKFPVEWHDCISTYSWLIPTRRTPISTPRVRPFEESVDVRSIIGALLWLRFKDHAYHNEEWFRYCFLQWFRQCQRVLPAVHISTPLPRDSKIQLFLDGLKKSGHICYSAIDDDQWALYVSSLSLIKGTNIIKVPSLGLHYKRDISLGRRFCPGCRDLEYDSIHANQSSQGLPFLSGLWNISEGCWCTDLTSRSTERHLVKEMCRLDSVDNPAQLSLCSPQGSNRGEASTSNVVRLESSKRITEEEGDAESPRVRKRARFDLEEEEEEEGDSEGVYSA